MHLLKPKPVVVSNPEAVFAEKYTWLMGWALHFARGNQSEAEDLVQDTFVRFVISESDLKDPERAEPLLYTYLKYVHLSHIRRTQRYPLRELPLVDFDSIHLAIRELPSEDPIEMQNKLRRIVAYLTWRKEKAKSASILLLRFFHGYRKEEIMRIGLVSDRVVANSLMSAREESRKHLSEGGDASRNVRGDYPPHLFPQRFAVSHDELLDELRRSIFDARQGACLPKEHLLKLYGAIDPKPIDCKLLSHLVSCERCLDVVSHFLGMPPLSDRSSEDGIGGERRTKSGFRSRSASSESGMQRVLRGGAQRLQDLYDHQPQQLMIAVNGHIVASRDISSASSKLEIEVNRETRIECIEIFSEQGLCILAMSVISIPPEGPPELRHQSNLMHGRSAEMVLRYTATGPLLDVFYNDSALAMAHSIPVFEEEIDSEDAFERAGEGRTNLLEDPLRARGLTFLQKLIRSFGHIHLPQMNPLLTSALLLGAASFLCLVLWSRLPPDVTANALLVKAEAWDPGMTKSATPGVVRQKVRVRSRSQIFDRTLYRDARGVRVPKPAALSTEERQLKAELATAHVVWSEPLSSVSYQDWHDSQRIRQDEVRRTGSNQLTLKTTVPVGEIAEQSITVRESDFHPIKRTVQFRDSGTVEIAELSYEVLPWSPESEEWFVPSTATATSIDGLGSHRAALLPRLPHVLSEIELDEAELSARLVLNRLGADASERIDVERVQAGIQVKGIVATEDRKREIETTLREIPHVIPAIFTFQDLQSGLKPSQPETSLKLSSAVAEVTPLERYLLPKGTSRETIGLLTDQLFDSSASISNGSKAIGTLLEHFSAEQRTDSSRDKLTQLVASHKHQVLVALQAEERLIADTGIAVPVTPEVPTTSPDFQQAAERNIALCRELVDGNVAQPRRAEVILPELLLSVNELRASLLQITASPHTD